MTRQLSAEEIAIFRECFNEYDPDRDGNITVEEFGRVMKKSDPNVSDEEVAKIVKEVDLDGDGTINFDEFITMMTGQPYQSAPAPAAAETKAQGMSSSLSSTVRGVSAVSAKLKRQRLANQTYKDAWREFDASLQGSITPSQLRQVLEKLGLTVTDVEVDEMIGSVENDGRITYDQFLDFAKRQEVDDIISGYGA